MIEKRTVFILGAGASCPYGFSTARGLRTDIVDHLRGRYDALWGDGLNAPHCTLNGYPDGSALEKFIAVFDKSNTESIDLFLSRHPQFATIGKLAILISILCQENKSCFGESAKEPKQDWYFYLYNRLTRELTTKDGYAAFGANEIAFVTFNYDRSLEHFLFESLLHSFEGADHDKVGAQLRRIPIVHVYGQVAPLPGLDKEGAEAVCYDRGSDPPGYLTVSLMGMIDDLYVVHEERANPCLKDARELISLAERIFFLGFGYAKENLEALGFPGVLRPEHLIYGTARGWTLKEIADIQTFFVQGLQQSESKPIDRPINAQARVRIRDCDCVELLREFL